jgi:hypothetical protein
MVVGQSEFSRIEHHRRLAVDASPFIAEAKFQHPNWTLWAKDGNDSICSEISNRDSQSTCLDYALV